MLPDCPDDFRRLPLRGGVLRAGHSLQRGEFLPRADHLAGQVRLAQVGRAAHGLPRLGRDLPRQLFGELHEALGAVVDRSQLLVPHDLLQLGDLVLEARLPVVLPVEAGVLEPRAKHRLESPADGLHPLAAPVPDRHEMGQQLPGLRLDGEVALMGPHRGDHDGRGQLEVALVEVSQDGVGPLHEIGDLLDQPGVRHGDSLDGLRRLGRERGHLVLPEGGIREDPVLLKRLGVMARALDLDPIRRQRSMAAGALPRRDPEGLERHDLSFQDAEEPADGPGEARAPFPMHGLGKGDPRDPGLHEPGQDLARRLSRIVHAGQEILPFGRGDAPQFLHLDSRALREPPGGVRRMSVGVEGDPDGGARQLAGLGLLALRQALHQKRQPSGRAHRLRGSESKARPGQALLRQGLELAEGGRDESGRKLLAADFQQEGLRHGRPPGAGVDGPAPLAA